MIIHMYIQEGNYEDGKEEFFEILSPPSKSLFFSFCLVFAKKQEKPQKKRKKKGKQNFFLILMES